MPGVAVMERGIEATFTGVQQTIVLAIHDNF